MAADLRLKRGALSGLPALAAGEPALTTDQIRLYLGSAGGNRLVGLLHRVDAPAAPTTGDDSADGYSPGSLWIDTTADLAYVCLDASVGAAVWQQTSGTGTGGITQLTGDGTAGPGSGSQALTLANDAVTNAKLANVATATFKGRVTSGTGDPEDLTGTQATTLLDTFTSSLKGLVPASGGGTSTFLRADGTFAAPTGGAVPNVLHNGGFEVWQNGTSITSNGDGSSTSDRWYQLQDAASSNANAQRVTGPTTSKYAQQFGPTGGSSRRMGVASIVEETDSLAYRGRTVRFQFQVKASTSRTVRYAILEWTGTANSVAHDVVNNWASGTFTAGNFFVGSNVTVVATGSVSATTSFAAASVTGTVSSSCNNLIVFVWSDSAMSTSETITVAECGLYDGTNARDWLPRFFAEELALCQRYLYKRADGAIGIALNADNMYSRGLERFPTTMRAAPTVSGASFSVNAGSAGTPSFTTTADGFAVTNSAVNWTATALVALNGATFSAEL